MKIPTCYYHTFARYNNGVRNIPPFNFHESSWNWKGKAPCGTPFTVLLTFPPFGWKRQLPSLQYKMYESDGISSFKILSLCLERQMPLSYNDRNLETVAKARILGVVVQKETFLIARKDKSSGRYTFKYILLASSLTSVFTLCLKTH